MQNSTRKWHAVYTRPNFEKKVAFQLSKKKIIHYCPVNTVQRELNEKYQSVSEPLFSSVVFVYVNAIEQIQVSQTSGVINFMYWLNRPAVIPEQEIDEIRKILSGFSEIQLRRTKVNLHEEVLVSSDTLQVRSGNVIEVSPDRVQVTLPSLGYVMEAAVKRRSSHETINNLALHNQTMQKLYSRIKHSFQFPFLSPQ